MKAGDEKRIKGLWKTWVICPDCGFGRYVQKATARQKGTTIRCKECHLKVAKQEMGRFFHA